MSLTASLLLGEKGGSKVIVNIDDTMLQLNIELWEDESDDNTLMLSITRLHLINIFDETTRRQLLTDASNWLAKMRNAAIIAATKPIMRVIQKGVNGWGNRCKDTLTFPLSVLKGIPLGSSGDCVGRHEEGSRCRPHAHVTIASLDLSTSMALRVQLDIDPFVEKSILLVSFRRQ